jgi:hypothetical protein
MISAKKHRRQSTTKLQARMKERNARPIADDLEKKRRKNPVG